MSHSLNNCVNCLPGQKDVDMALKSIGEASKKLLIETVSLPQSQSPSGGFFSPNTYMTIKTYEIVTLKLPGRCSSLYVSSFLLFSSLSALQIPPASKSFQEAQSDLNQTAADLNQSAGEVVHASRGSSSQLAVASGKFSQDFDEFLDAGIEMAGHTQVGLMSLLSACQSRSVCVCVCDVIVLSCLEKG